MLELLAFIRPFFISAWLTTTILSPVSVVFEKKCQRKSNCLRRLLTTRWRRVGYESGHFSKFSNPVSLRRLFFFSDCLKRLVVRVFPKTALISKKCLLKVTSTTFLFKEVEQLAVYQLLPNLAIWEHLW